MTDTTIQLSFEKRELTGKKVKKIRKLGQVPIVIHDHGKPSVIAQVSLKELVSVISAAGKHHPVVLKSTDQKREITTMIKETDYEPQKQTLSHVVFNSIFTDQLVEAEIPIKPRYAEGNESSPAERAGLIVIEHLESVLVEALPNNLPDAIFYDAEKLVEPSDHLSIGDLILPKNVTLKSDPTASIASVYEPSAIEAANNALAGGEEETIETTEESAVEENPTSTEAPKE